MASWGCGAGVGAGVTVATEQSAVARDQNGARQKKMLPATGRASTRGSSFYPLFSDGDLSAALDNQFSGIKGSVHSIPREQFLATSVDTLREHLSAPLAIEPLVLLEEQMQMDPAETQVDVTGRFDYDMGRRGRVHTTGID